MVTVEDVQDYLPDENTRLIEKTIRRTEGYLKSYTNDPALFDNDPLELEDVVLFLVLRRLGEAKYAQGLKSQSMGEVSHSFQEDLPLEIKYLLAKYNKPESLL